MSNLASSDVNMRHMNYIDGVVAEDCAVLRVKEATYMGSWKRAGGRSAWFMARRNMDRLIQMLAPPAPPKGFSLEETVCAVQNAHESLGVRSGVRDFDVKQVEHMAALVRAEDVFAKIEEHPEGEDGTVLACLRDLRRYLVLVEAEMRARGVVRVEVKATHRDDLVEPAASKPNPELTGYYQGPTTVNIPPGYSANVFVFTSPVTDPAQASERRVPRFENEPILRRHEVSNGANGMKPGDRVVHTLDECVGTALEFLQDGDALVRFDGNQAISTVKWSHLIPANASEPNRPGTPEDGGHHGSTTPWICDEAFLLESKLTGELVGKFWSQRSRRTFVLESHVWNHSIPRMLRDVYNMRGESWTLRPDRVPPELRDYFPSLPLEQNMKEWEELPEWQRVLYTWLDGESKYRLAVENHAWHVEAE